jgi:hypothetical protein
MKGRINPKILGSTIVGFALVAGAYTVANFGEPRFYTNENTVQTPGQTQRLAIAVTDNDNNGIEDWRDDFVTAPPVILDQASSTYTFPDTLTGQMSISLLEDVIRARGYGPFGSSDEEIITGTINRLEEATVQTLYDIKDISVIDSWSTQDIINYANTMAGTIYRHSIPEMDNELVILKNVLDNNDPGAIEDLKTLANIYKLFLDDSLKTPVPAFLVKEHLDIINTYSAIHKDIEAMSMVLEDPALSLLRLRRYEDDAMALVYAMQNMFLAIAKTDAQFETSDPATFFTLFSPDYQN